MFVGLREFEKGNMGEYDYFSLWSFRKFPKKKLKNKIALREIKKKSILNPA